MLSLPEDRDYTLKGLALINREKINAIRQAIRELEQAGYIVCSRERDERGRLRGADYVIFEQPQTPPALDYLRWISRRRFLRYRVFRQRFIQRRRQRNGLFVDDVLVAAELAALVRGLVALDVPGPLQFVDGGTNSILAFPVDTAQARQGVIPIFQEGQHLRQQALGFQGQGLVTQVW